MRGIMFVHYKLSDPYHAIRYGYAMIESGSFREKRRRSTRWGHSVWHGPPRKPAHHYRNRLAAHKTQACTQSNQRLLQVTRERVSLAINRLLVASLHSTQVAVVAVAFSAPAASYTAPAVALPFALDSKALQAPFSFARLPSAY